MQLLTLSIDTVESEARTICELYWDLASDYSYTHNIEDIAIKFNKKKTEISNLVKTNCIATFSDFRCKLCDIPLATFRIRNDFVKFFNGFNGSINTTKKVCNKCLIESDEKEINRLKKSFDDGLFETLNDVEFNFLFTLAKHNEIEIARTKVGISIEKALHFQEIFYKKGILGKHGNFYFFLPEFKHKLEKLTQRPKIKSLFFSKMTQDFYRKLKSEFLFVFIEVPLCSFVEQDDVKHLFQTPSGEWLGSYFFTCRLDFVVCDENGFPKFAVEYQGGYHSDTKKVISRDLFKGDVLNEIGLTLYQCPRDNELLFSNSQFSNYQPIYSIDN